MSKAAEQHKVTQEWNAMADDWDDLASSYSDSFEKLLWRQTEMDTPPEDLVVLDFGCGTGLLTERIRKKVRQVICIDASPAMMNQVDYKIRAGEWDNVEAYTCILSELEKADAETKAAIEKWEGKIDLIAASSVLGFIPDLECTLQVLGKLLKSETGILCHSDWPKGKEAENGFTREKAEEMYQTGGLVSKSTDVVDMMMGTHMVKVFIGVATKP